MVKEVLCDWFGICAFSAERFNYFEPFGYSISQLDCRFKALMNCLYAGRITERDFFTKIISELNIKGEFAKYWRDYEAQFNIYPNALQFLSALRSTHRVHLVSNISEGAAKYWRQSGIGLYFDQLFFSCEINLVKPNVGFFNFVASELKITFSEMLLIDDNKKNLIAAEKLGIRTYLHAPNLEK